MKFICNHIETQRKVDCAKELQIETDQICNKGDYELGLEEWPQESYL